MLNRRSALVAAALLAVLVVAAKVLPLAQWTIQLAEFLRASGARGILLFVAVYAVGTVALVPGSMLTMLAGFVYGPARGLLIVVPASLLGATCSFLLGRTVLRDWVRRRLVRSPRMRALDRAIERDAFTLVLLLRLSPLVPFNALNYALSLSGITPARFVLATCLGEIPGTLLYVYLGSLVTTAAQLSAGSAPQTPLRTFFYAVGFVATVAAAAFSARIARRALTDAMPRDEVSR